MAMVEGLGGQQMEATGLPCLDQRFQYPLNLEVLLEVLEIQQNLYHPEILTLQASKS